MNDLKIKFKSISPKYFEDFKKLSIKDLIFDDTGAILIVDKLNKIGILTDGDVRRGIDRYGLNAEPHQLINWNPVLIKNCSSNEIHKKCNLIFKKNKNINVIPIIKDDESIDFAYKSHELDKSKVSVVIMAGGFGTRLKDLTLNTPKPMLKIGGKPIIERIINNLTGCGYKKIYISVYYLKNIIMDYFKDGTDFDCNIEYIEEEEPLGTFGCLSLKEFDSEYIFVCNGDLYNKFEIEQLHGSILNKESDFVVATTSFSTAVPYGVIETQNNIIKNIKEKPTLNFSVAAGQYFFKNKLLKHLDKGKTDAPDFLNTLLGKNINISTFTLINNWIDIGIPDQLELANDSYED